MLKLFIFIPEQLWFICICCHHILYGSDIEMLTLYLHDYSGRNVISTGIAPGSNGSATTSCCCSCMYSKRQFCGQQQLELVKFGRKFIKCLENMLQSITDWLLNRFNKLLYQTFLWKENCLASLSCLRSSRAFLFLFSLVFWHMHGSSPLRENLWGKCSVLKITLMISDNWLFFLCSKPSSSGSQADWVKLGLLWKCYWNCSNSTSSKIKFSLEIHKISHLWS